MRLSRTATLYFIIPLTILSLASPIALAKSTYWMPTFGVSWASRTVDVSVPTRPALARDIVVKAVEIWNEAQLWFKVNYLPEGKVYTFLIDKRSTDILVDFTDYWSVSNYCPSIPLGVLGCTTLSWNYSRNITQAIVFLDTTQLTNPDTDSIFLVLHELGHALGLPDLPFSLTSFCQYEDLFCMYYADRYPSTLDLYALHELAGGSRETRIPLPSRIPYYYYAPPASLIPTSTVAATTATALKASLSLSLHCCELNQLASFVAAALTCSGTAILFAFIVKRSKHHSRGRGRLANNSTELG